MLFGFRGIRAFQLLLALITLVTGVGAAFSAKAYTDTHSPGLFIATIALGLVFLWMFSTALRAPTSFVAVAPERTRIRFSGFVDTVIDNHDILGVRVTRFPLYGGLGVRTNFRGTVALTSATGQVAEFQLRKPIRVWLIPKLVPLRATRLIVSVRNPAKLAERFGQPPAAPVPAAAPARAHTPRRTKRRGT